MKQVPSEPRCENLKKRLPLCGAVLLLLLAIPNIALAAPVNAAKLPTTRWQLKDWQYGVIMQPPISQYDVAEMSMNGFYWSTSPPTQAMFFMVESRTTAPNAAHVGILYNGLNSALQIDDCPPSAPSIPPHSWGFFYEYTVGTTYHGCVINPPSGWLATDKFYFSERVIPSKGEMVFQILNANRGVAIDVAVCHAAISGRFNTNVSGFAEGSTSSGFDTIYAHQTALWAEDLSGGYRWFGPGYATTTTDSPSNIKTYVYYSNFFDVGFMSYGAHYPSGQLLWTSQGYLGLEAVPPDMC
jgi:hypothetical protein